MRLARSRRGLRALATAIARDALCLATALVLAWPAAAPAGEMREVRAGAWTVEIPEDFNQFRDWQSPAYGVQLEGRFHTVILEVVMTDESHWGKDVEYPDLTRPEAALREDLRAGLEQRMEEERGLLYEPRGRISELTVEAADAALLPDQSVCAGNRWHAVDVGVPGHVGKPFDLHGIDMVCADFSIGAGFVGVIRISLSERYCAELGHAPIPDFDGYAAGILTTVRFAPVADDLETSELRRIGDAGDILALFGQPRGQQAVARTERACPHG